MRFSTKPSTRSSTTASTATTAAADKGLLDSRNKKVALLIAVIALCLAFSETLGKSAQTAALSYNVEASNLWAFFQAKTIRQTVLQAATEILKIDRSQDDGERRRRDQGGAGQAHRQLGEDRRALRLRADGAAGAQGGQPQSALRRGPPRTDGARDRRRGASATPRWSATTTTRSRRPRSRSASCWRRRR